MLIVGYSRMNTKINRSVYQSECSKYLTRDEILNVLLEVEKDLEDL